MVEGSGPKFSDCGSQWGQLASLLEPGLTYHSVCVCGAGKWWTRELDTMAAKFSGKA